MTGEVVLELPQHRQLLRVVGLHAIGARAGGVGVQVFLPIVPELAELARLLVGQNVVLIEDRQAQQSRVEGRVGLGQGDDCGALVLGDHVLDPALEQVRKPLAQGGHAVEREDHVVGVEHVAAMELHPLAERDGVGRPVDVDLLGQVRMDSAGAAVECREDKGVVNVIEENGIGHVLGLVGIQLPDRHLVGPQHGLGLYRSGKRGHQCREHEEKAFHQKSLLLILVVFLALPFPHAGDGAVR